VVFKTPTAIKTIGAIRHKAEELHAQYPGMAVHALGTERGFGAEKLAAAKPVGKVQKAIVAYLETKNDKSADRDELLRHCGHGVHFGAFTDSLDVLAKKGLVKMKDKNVTLVTESDKTASRVASRFVQALMPYPTMRTLGNFKDPKLISRLVNDRTDVDWITDPRSELYQQKSQDSGFLEYTVPSVKKQFAEVNDLIREATTRCLKRLKAWQKLAVPQFEELGYTVKLGKFTSVVQSSDWADYDFRQIISITDNVFGGTENRHLTWGFRDFVYLSEYQNHWTSFSSDSQIDAPLTFAAMVLSMKEHLQKNAWKEFIAWRQKKMTEKGVA